MSDRRENSPSPRCCPLHRLIVIQILTVAAILSVPGCGASLELTSEWSGRQITVDGASLEWSGMQVGIAGPDVRIGIKNDKDNLYVCLTTPSSTTQFQMLALGTTVWFDADGRKIKTFGIQFPVRGLLQGRRPRVPENADEARQVVEGLVNAAQRQFEIIGPGDGERRRIADRQVQGIDVHLGYENGILTYELKIPLRRTADTPYGVALGPAKSFMIGFETGDYADAMRSRMNVQGRTVGGSSGGGGRSGRGSSAASAPAIPGSDSPEPLKHWIMVYLAGEPGSTTR